MGAQFDPDQWLDQWMMVGGVLTSAAVVCIVANLDGNSAGQQSLLSMLDAKRGRRADVRVAALARQRAVT
jgi:hypothetical protein